MRNGSRSQAGYSLIETMLVVGIMGVVTSIAVIQIKSAKPALSGDGAMRVVLSQLNQAKELAITQRRNMRVTFTGNNSVQIFREEVPFALTPISSVPFEGGLKLLRITTPAIGEPAAPELPSPAATAPYTGGGVAFGSATEMKFSPDGVFIDQDGNTLNGSLFLALPSQVLSARAVTLFGSTGRIRGFRWDGRIWKVV